MSDAKYLIIWDETYETYVQEFTDRAAAYAEFNKIYTYECFSGRARLAQVVEDKTAAQVCVSTAVDQ